MPYIYYINRIRQNNFTALKTPCVSSIHPPPHPSFTWVPGNHWSFYWLYSLAFSRKVWNWNQTMCGLLDWLLSLRSFKVHHAFWQLDSSFFKNSWLILCNMEEPQFIHLPREGHLNSFQFLIIRNTAALNIYMQVFVWPHLFKSTG